MTAACHTPPCAGHAVADPAAHQQWHADQRAAAEPAGPLDPVHACARCSALVVDIDQHLTVCRAAPLGEGISFREQLVGFLDTIDPDELEKKAFADATLDDSPTVAILDALKRYAAAP